MGAGIVYFIVRAREVGVEPNGHLVAGEGLVFAVPFFVKRRYRFLVDGLVNRFDAVRVVEGHVRVGFKVSERVDTPVDLCIRFISRVQTL